MCRQKEERDLGGKLGVWACQKINIKGKPFSFVGHEYLKAIYADQSSFIVLEKAVQMGASIWGTLKAMQLADVYGEDTTYFFPVKGSAFNFSGARVRDEIIKTSPLIMALMSREHIDAVEGRRIGRGLLNFRGMKELLDVQSNPADQVIIDEYDLISNFKRVEEAFDRLGHSNRKWKVLIGIPSIEDYGIDAWWRKSDQHYWNLVCPECGAFNCLEDNFADDVFKYFPEKNGRTIRICRQCAVELNCQCGKWIAQNLGAEIRGYHLSQLFSEYVNLADILKLYREKPQDENLWRQKIGRPKTSAENQLTIIELMACCRTYTVEDIQNLRSNLNFMGVDTGKNQHYIIAKKNGEEYKTLRIGYCEDFSELRLMMDQYNVGTCVIDPGGNITATKEFVEAFPGRAYACYYHANDAVYADFNEADLRNSKIAAVNAHRTATMDTSANLIRGQQWLINREEPNFKEFAKHCMNSVRKKDEDIETGKTRFTYIRTGADHWRHAQNYCMIAGSKKRPEKHIRSLN